MWKSEEGIDSAYETTVRAYQLEARSKRVAAYAKEHGVSLEAAERAIPPINTEPREGARYRMSKAFQLREQAENERRLAGNK